MNKFSYNYFNSILYSTFVFYTITRPKSCNKQTYFLTGQVDRNAFHLLVKVFFLFAYTYITYMIISVNDLSHVGRYI